MQPRRYQQGNCGPPAWDPFPLPTHLSGEAEHGAAPVGDTYDPRYFRRYGGSEAAPNYTGNVFGGGGGGSGSDHDHVFGKPVDESPAERRHDAIGRDCTGRGSAPTCSNPTAGEFVAPTHPMDAPEPRPERVVDSFVAVSATAAAPVHATAADQHLLRPMNPGVQASTAYASVPGDLFFERVLDEWTPLWPPYLDEVINESENWAKAKHIDFEQYGFQQVTEVTSGESEHEMRRVLREGGYYVGAITDPNVHETLEVRRLLRELLVEFIASPLKLRAGESCKLCLKARLLTSLLAAVVAEQDPTLVQSSKKKEPFCRAVLNLMIRLKVARAQRECCLETLSSRGKLRERVWVLQGSGPLKNRNLGAVFRVKPGSLMLFFATGQAKSNPMKLTAGIGTRGCDSFDIPKCTTCGGSPPGPPIMPTDVLGTSRCDDPPLQPRAYEPRTSKRPRDSSHASLHWPHTTRQPPPTGYPPQTSMEGGVNQPAASAPRRAQTSPLGVSSLYCSESHHMDHNAEACHPSKRSRGSSNASLLPMCSPEEAARELGIGQLPVLSLLTDEDIDSEIKGLPTFPKTR